MSLTVLASVSLLALVSSAHPIPKAEEFQDRVQVSALGDPADVQQAVHAVLKSHASAAEELKDGEAEISIRIALAEELQAILATIDQDAVKLIVPLDAGNVHSPDEAELVAILNRVELEGGLRTPVSDEALDKLDLDTTTESHSKQSDASDERLGNPIALDPPRVPTKPIIVLIAASIAALLAVCCVATALYTIDLLRKHVFQSDMAWDMLTRVEKRFDRSMDLKAGTVQVISEKDAGPIMPGTLMMPQVAISKLLLSSSEESCSEKDLSLDFTGEDTAEDSNEKFYNAETMSTPFDSPYVTPNISTTDLSLPKVSATSPIFIVPASNSNVHHDSLPRSHTMSEMSETTPVSATLSPSGTRSSWSMRAAEVKLPVIEQHCHAHRERPRSAFTAVPEFDAALAMQLRPGLGIGADAAWFVRFVMTLFGWCAVLMSGRRDYWY